METLSTADGQRVDLDESDAEFARAMAAPGPDEPEAPAPPKRDPADPEAPYGRKVDGTPKKAPGGRPPKPRMIEAPASSGSQGKGSKDSPPPADYTAALVEFTSALCLVMGTVPVPHDELRVRVRAQSWVLEQNQGNVASAVNAMAQHNATIRTGVEKLTMGNAGWVLPAVMTMVPFAVQTAAIWRAPVEGDMRTLADNVESGWKAKFEAMKADFAAEAEAAAQATQDGQPA